MYESGRDSRGRRQGRPSHAEGIGPIRETDPARPSPWAIVVIPTYNERENLPLLIEAITRVEPQIDILVVDDNSPDGTGRVAEALAAGVPRMSVLHRTRKNGLGSAYVAGFQHALSRNYQYVCEMDADFSHRPEDLPRLLAEAERVPVVVGSRNVPGGQVIGWSLLRRFVSKAGSFYARVVLGLPLHDVTSGFKCFRRSALELVDLDSLRANGYAFQVEVNHLCHRAGLSFSEVPIVFRDRVRGRSKMSPGIAFEAAWLVLALRLGSRHRAIAPPSATPTLAPDAQGDSSDLSSPPSTQAA